jgi:argonaute-like protein implicated in RNA metabolism and viral defense
MRFLTTGNHKIQGERCCIVFESASGKIRHVHRVITMLGGTERGEKEIAERALALAKKHGATGAKLDVIHIDPKTVEARGHYRVDLKNRTLVASTT